MLEDPLASAVPKILRGMLALESASRHLAPQDLDEIAATLGERATDLGDVLERLREESWPEHLGPIRDCLRAAGDAAREGLNGLIEAPEDPQPMLAAYRALRCYSRACDALYPLGLFLPEVSAFFLEPAMRQDPVLAARLAAIDPQRQRVGTMHIGGPPAARGAYSLYVPEYAAATEPLPLIVALHGGRGNGAAFLWFWLREARSRGLILIAPTALGATWSLTEPEIDGPNITRIISEVSAEWPVDRARCLLTGMSDGGTFSYVLGSRADSGFTHLAPLAAAFHPMLLAGADPARLKGLPVRITHGLRDWMFAPALARMAAQSLKQAGAAVTLRLIDDLSHTYPREENAMILDWFLAPA